MNPTTTDLVMPVRTRPADGAIVSIAFKLYTERHCFFFGHSHPDFRYTSGTFRMTERNMNRFRRVLRSVAPYVYKLDVKDDGMIVAFLIYPEA